MDKIYFVYIVWPIIVGTIVYHYRLQFLRLARTKIVFDENHPRLVIGIMSAREHFEERQVIRDTWGSVLKTDPNLASRVEMRFVVGDTACAIPVEGREDEFSCNPWIFSDQAHSEHQHLSAIASVPPNDSTSSHQNFYSQSTILFQVHFDIVLDKLGVHENLISHYPVQVQLLHESSMSEIVGQVFTADNPGISIEGFRYKAIEPFFFPKGFEGRVSVMGLNGNTVDVQSDNLSYITTSTGGGLVQYRQIPGWEDDHHIQPAVTRPVVSFAFSIHDRKALQDFQESQSRREEEWRQTKVKEAELIQTEVKDHDDLLVLPALTDIYRHLPTKLLSFLQWQVYNMNADYVMKTDDDCFVNITAVMHTLDKWPTLNPSLWWGSFRSDWAVERHGKWAEYDYSSSVYPSFTCGSGYVLGSRLARWLSSNVDHLHTFQGEDVSLGIWLAAVRHQKKESSNWSCSDVCTPGIFTIAQLDPMKILQLWQNYLACNNPCGCS